MRRYLRPSAIDDPVSAWGLNKSDDDQTHSDDLGCRGGRLSGKLARLGTGLPAAPGSGLLDGALSAARRLSAGRPGRLSPGTAPAGFRRAGRRRAAEFDRAAAARPGAFAGRSALWAALWRAAGLLQPRSDPFAR